MTVQPTSSFVNANGIRLHYLDWGGRGPVMLFLTGLGLSAYVYSRLAPCFSDHFRVIAMTRRGHGDSDYPPDGYDADTLTEDVYQLMNALGIEQAILVGHSMSNIEMCHLTARHPERVAKLVFLDAAYDRSTPTYKNIAAKNPLQHIPVPEINHLYTTIEDYVAALKRAHPSYAAIWGEVMDEDVLHSLQSDAEGKLTDRMSPEIIQALMETLGGYVSEDTAIRVPTLSIYTINSSADYLSSDYMTAEQQAQVVNFFEVVRPPLQRESIEQFRRNVPQAKIVEIPQGHHFCFIKHEDIVIEEMRRFLLP